MSNANQTQPQKSSKSQLLIAGILGITAAVLVLLYLNNSEGDETGAAIPMAEIVIAEEAIETGEKITSSMLSVGEVAESSVAPDFFTSQSLVVDRVARYPIEKGEPITAGRLVDAPEVQLLSFQIPAGLRGMTIPVRETETPAALMGPGDFIDVIVRIDQSLIKDDSFLLTLAGDENDLIARIEQSLTGDSLLVTLIGEDDNGDFKVSLTLLQNIQVLSIDRSYADTGVIYEPSTRAEAREEDDRVSFVTLAVTPEQAQLLWLAQDKGLLTLVLRPFGDDEITPLGPTIEPFVILGELED